MIDIINMKSSDFENLSFLCECGRNHSVEIQKILIGKNIINKLSDIISVFKQGSIFLMSDNNTYEVAGKNVKEALGQSLPVKSFVFEADKQLVPDEKALGRLLVEIEDDTSLIISIGSGSLNDLARMISSKCKIPYIIVATAPSMDGYASTVSPLIIDGFKKTIEAVYPYAILADYEILKTAPYNMLCAGFGDIIGKYTALSDWKLSAKINNEYLCEKSFELMSNAVNKCLENIDGISSRDEVAILNMVEVLILSGLAMGLVGNSRPASGAEHHLAHYWEMDAIKKGEEHPLHGNCVGVGTVIISRIYEIVKAKFDIGIDVISSSEVRKLLRHIGACDNPKDLGIDKDVFKESILLAMNIRPRYTIFKFIKEKGIIEEIAEQLTDEFYIKDCKII